MTLEKLVLKKFYYSLIPFLVLFVISFIFWGPTKYQLFFVLGYFLDIALYAPLLALKAKDKKMKLSFIRFLFGLYEVWNKIWPRKFKLLSRPFYALSVSLIIFLGNIYFGFWALLGILLAETVYYIIYKNIFNFSFLETLK